MITFTFISIIFTILSTIHKCKWCYADGKYVYTRLEELINFLVVHMSNETYPPEQVRTYLETQLPQLNHWK